MREVSCSRKTAETAGYSYPPAAMRCVLLNIHRRGPVPDFCGQKEAVWPRQRALAGDIGRHRYAEAWGSTGWIRARQGRRGRTILTWPGELQTPGIGVCMRQPGRPAPLAHDHVTTSMSRVRAQRPGTWPTASAAAWSAPHALASWSLRGAATGRCFCSAELAHSLYMWLLSVLSAETWAGEGVVLPARTSERAPAPSRAARRSRRVRPRPPWLQQPCRRLRTRGGTCAGRPG